MRVPIRKPDKYLKAKIDPRITAAKFLELEKKLKEVKKIRPKLANEVKRLVADGDFSENAAYQIAKGKLRGLNQKILEIEEMIKMAEIIEPSRNKNLIGLGSTVTIENSQGEKTYKILGSTESNPSAGIISGNSPLGKTLIGKRIGDTIDLKTPQKTIKYKIKQIK